MICQFSFENYKVFKEEAFLDFVAEPIREYKESLITDKVDQEKYVPVIAIYGPNGGGKSTVLDALIFLRDYLVNPIILTRFQEDERNQFNRILNRLSSRVSDNCYHKFDPKCKDRPTRFDILFRTHGVQFRYQLSLLQFKILEENFYSQRIGDEEVSLIFERTEEDCVLGEAVEDISVEKVKSSMPLLSHIAIHYDIDQVDMAIEWFLNMDVINYDDFRSDHRLKIPKEESRKRRMFEVLHAMDIPMEDVRVEKDLEGNVKAAFARYRSIDGGICDIPMEEESSGTIKLLSFLADCISSLEDGHFIVADELDAKLHPKILQFLIEQFTDPQTNEKGAQLLLTSHDITTMSPKVFRRDEIWFCAKNPYGASKLYSLAAFRKEDGAAPRNDEAYGKRYLEGRYGADPYIRRALDWGDEIESQTEEIQ